MKINDHCPHISLVNVWSDHNRGDAAIVLATLEMVARVYPRALVHLHNVVFHSHDLAMQIDRHFASFQSTGLRIFPALFPALVVKREEAIYSRTSRVAYALRAILMLLLARLSPRFGKLLLSRDEREAYDSLIQSDLVISKGGSYLLANTWKDVLQLLMVFLPLLLAALAGRKTLLFGVSIGPARSKIAAWFLRWCLKRMDRIVVREEFAKATCHRLGIPQHVVVMLPDIALASNLFSEQPARRLTPQLRRRTRPLIGVTVRRWAFDDIGERERREANYFRSLATALRQFQAAIHGTVVLIPQVVGPNREGSDLEAIDLLMKLLGDCPNVARLPATLNVDELRTCYAYLDLLVGTRLHSVLLGFGIPVVMIGYQGDKSIGTARLLGCEDYFIHINDINAEQLLLKMTDALSNQQRIRNALAHRRVEFERQFLRTIPEILTFPGLERLNPRGLEQIGNDLTVFEQPDRGNDSRGAVSLFHKAG